MRHNMKPQPPALPFQSLRCREKTRAYMGTLVRVYRGIALVGEGRVIGLEMGMGALYVRWVSAKSWITDPVTVCFARDCKALEG